MRKQYFRKISLALIVAALFSMTAQFAYASTKEEPEVKVEVYANIYGDEYIKNIEFDDGTTVGDYHYEIEYKTPAARDVNYLYGYFNYAAWITRNNEKILSLDPTTEVRLSGTKKEVAWNLLSDPTYGIARDANWPTDSQKLKTFKWQYDCHFNYAVLKDRWNLEPYRVASSYQAVVDARCNP